MQRQNERDNILTDEELCKQYAELNQYVLDYILNLIKDYQLEKRIAIAPEFIEKFHDIFKHNTTNYTLLSLILAIPEHNEIAEMMLEIDVEAIIQVRKLVIAEMAKHLQHLLLDMYHRLSSNSENNVSQSRLKNHCLSYLCVLDQPEMKQLAISQFRKALIENDLTNTYAAMCALANDDTAERMHMYDDFYTKWQKNPIGISKWYSATASSLIPSALDSLIYMINEDQAFDTSNATQVRAITTPLCKNFEIFHSITGKGYLLLTKLIIKADMHRPKLAIELAENYLNWDKLIEPHQSMIKNELLRIAQDKNISKHLSEFVSKSLGTNLALQDKFPPKQDHSLLNHTLFSSPLTPKSINVENTETKSTCCML